MNVTQINLNRSWAAFDLLKQRLCKSKTELVLISEPPGNIPAGNNWLVSGDGLAAILLHAGPVGRGPFGLVARGESLVVARLADISVMSCYCSPNVGIDGFMDFLDEMERVMRALTGHIVVGGDFNAHSVFWGADRTSRRGELLERWMAA